MKNGGQAKPPFTGDRFPSPTGEYDKTGVYDMTILSKYHAGVSRNFKEGQIGKAKWSAADNCTNWCSQSLPFGVNGAEWLRSLAQSALIWSYSLL